MSTTIQQPTQRIRGPKLEVFISRLYGLPFDEELARADKDNRVIVSSKRLSSALIGSDEWKAIKKAFACWSGTMTAYVEPNVELGQAARRLSDLGDFPKLSKNQYEHAIVYTDPQTGNDWIFPIPEKYLRVKNGILVIEHPDYGLDREGTNRLVLPVSVERVDLVEGFPVRNGWYLPDAIHGIPQTSQVDYSTKARHLWRVDKRVGPVRLGYDDMGGIDDINGRYVDFDDRPSNGYGLVTEASEAGTPATKDEIKTSRQSSVIQLNEGDSELIIRGSDAKIEAALRLLESLR
ncbi:MAG: hypothetical protein AABX38_00295 [Candidatus Micrarchaeota archaeon]